jgi:hypothetical protein
LIDSVIEPLLGSSEIQTAIQYINTMNPITRGLRIEPRSKFYETKWRLMEGGGNTSTSYYTVREKTPIQKMIDTHWYGYQDRLITTDTGVYALVDTDADSKIYESDYKIAKTLDDGTIQYNEFSSGVQPGAREKRFGIKYVPATSFKGSLGMTVHTAPASDWLVECVSTQDDDQTWHVKCSTDSEVHVITTRAYVGTPFVIGDLSFEFINYSSTQTCFNGDSFIIRAGTKKGIKVNVQGTFNVITSVPTDLSIDYFTYNHIDENPDTDDNSWLIVVERVDDSEGNTLYYQVTNREAKMICESVTTKFWFTDSDTIVDSTTQKVLRDSISVLKSNLVADLSAPLGTNREFYINGVEKDNAGNDIYTRINILPSHEGTDYYTTANVNAFSDLIDITSDYVYFTVENGVYTPITDIAGVVDKFTDATQMIFIPDEADSDQTVYARKQGRSGLDFLWIHYAPNDSIIDASTTNINDIYVLTKGFYSSMISYVRGLTDSTPQKPTSLELKNSYSSLLSSKMMSDTVVLHSADIKLLFGEKSDKQLRCKFKVIRNPKGGLSDETIKREIVSAINSYFTIEAWNFGDTFFAQDMLSKIQTQLAGEINSIVLVPSYANNYFGNMLIVECGMHEILQSCATIDDIDIVSTYSDSNLRIK